MIVYIKGKTAAVGKDYAIVENGGIGYQIFMPGSMLECLHAGMEVKIHTYYHVREDAVSLFGFLTEGDLNLFRLLISVNGIGPKAALGILSALTPDEVQFAVLADDVNALAKAPGIGKKTAQKLILELKDKLNLEEQPWRRSRQKIKALNKTVAGKGLRAVAGKTLLCWGETP